MTTMAFLKSLPAVLCLGLICTGCVATAQDLRDLATNVRGSIERNEQAASTFADELEALADEVEAREEATRNGLGALEQGGLIGGASTLLSYFLVNKSRDNRRKMRGEVVDSAKV